MVKNITFFLSIVVLVSAPAIAQQPFKVPTTGRLKLPMIPVSLPWAVLSPKPFLPWEWASR